MKLPGKHKYENEHPSWAWIDEIQVGDILISATGTERVVRKVTRFKVGDRYGRDGIVSSIHLTILKCSWTHRCHTVLNRTALKTRKFKPSGKRKTTISMLDKLIAHDTIYYNNQRLDCCDVKGIR